MLTASGISALTCILRLSRQRSISVSSLYQYRKYSTEPLTLPKADEESKEYPEKIQNIVTQISNLTLLEVADLNELLKKTLNISEAPVMAMGAMPAAQVQDAEEEEAGTAKVQTNFALRITKFDETKKVPLIKYVKTVMEGMNLVQAKKFVESLPAVVRTDASKDEAEKLKDELVAVGAECVIE